MPKRLFIDRIDAIGFVDNGANQLADIAIWKRAATAEEGNSALSENTQGQPAPNLMQRVRTALGLVDSELEKAAKAAESKEGNTGDQPMAEQNDQLASQTEELQEQIATLTKRAEEAEEALTAANDRIAAAEAREPTGSGEADDVMKNLPEDVRKRFDDLEKRASEAEEIAKAERDARQTAEFTKAAKDDYANLPGKLEEKVDTLRAIAALPDDERAKIETMLKAVDAQSATSELFKEAGSGNADLGSDSWGKIVAKASALVEAGKEPTREQAIAKVLADDKELAAAYNQDRASGGAG